MSGATATLRPDSEVRLYALVGYDPALEGAALVKLADLDAEACRLTLGRLVAALRLEDAPGRGREVAALLLDVLHRVNRRMNRPGGDDAIYHRFRQDLIATFAGVDEAEEARRRFHPALARLLSPLTSARPDVHPLVERAKTYIEENYARRISLSDVAERLHVSSNHLSRLFRRETAVTLTAYVHRVRLGHATLLLAEGGRSLSEIAYLVGYQNYRDFYRNFVKQQHASPREFRQRRTPVSSGASGAQENTR